MYSITAVARKVGLPRRTVQYWHDKNVIVPINLEPIVYSDDELRLARILAAVSHSKPSIGYLNELSEILRMCIYGSDDVPKDVDAAFAAARDGRDAYFCLSLETGSDGETMAWTFGCVSKEELQAAVADQISARPNLALTIVDLKYCFDLDAQVGAAMPDA